VLSEPEEEVTEEVVLEEGVEGAEIINEAPATEPEENTEE
jgi:hypothetical protein